MALATKYVVLWIQKGENGPTGTPQKKKKRGGIARYEEPHVIVLLDGGSLTWSLKIQHGGQRWFIAQTLV